MPPSILKNISWLGVGNAVVKPLWFVFITAVCVRILGIAEYGIVTASLALVGIVMSLTNVGSSQYSIREIARDRSRASEFLSNFLPFRVTTGLAGVVVICLVGLALGHRGGDFTALLFAALYGVAMNLTEYCRALYRAFELLRYEAVSIILEKILVIAAGTALLLMDPRASGVLAGMAIGMFLTLVANLGWVVRKLARFDFKLFRPGFFSRTLPYSFPLGLASIFVVLYLRTDSIMLEAMQGEIAAGRYGLAFRILEAMILLPAIVVAAFLPRLSALYGERSNEKFRQLMKRGLLGLASVGLVLAAVMTFAAPVIIPLLEPDPSAAPAISIMQILMWTFPFSAVNYLLSTSMTARDDQKALAWMLGAAAVFNISLNAILIPLYTYYGACVATLTTQVLITGVMFGRYIRRGSGP
jgi:O-antigen/teichoic acid export membrane protein